MKGEYNKNAYRCFVSKTALYTDKDIYKPGDEVKIDLWFDNSGEQEDFIANLVLKHDITEDVVDGLFLRSINDLKGLGSSQLFGILLIMFQVPSF